MAKAKITEEKKIDELPIIGKQPETPEEEKYLREICEYEFYNSEDPGLAIKFPYGSGKRNFTFTFHHGERYKIPRHVARHVESCSTPLFKWTPNGQGQMVKMKAGTKSRFQMRPIYG